MYEDYDVAGSGLRTMFQAQIAVIIGAVIMFIPLIGTVVGLITVVVAGVMILSGLYAAGPAHEFYRKAFTFEIANLLLSLVYNFMDEGLLKTALGVAETAIGVYTIYLICTATEHLLSAKGDNAQAARGQFIWKLYLGCAVAGTVCAVLTVIPVINILAAIAAVVVGIVQLVAGIIYLMFLYNAYQSLLS